MTLWKRMLDKLVEIVKPEAVSQNLADFRQNFGDDPEIVAAALSGFIAEFFIHSIGFFAILDLPVDEALTALDEIKTTLHNLDFETGRDKLKRRERQDYDMFAKFAGELYPRLGTAMRALLGTYARGDYDPQADPDELIQQGLELGQDEAHQDRGRELITQASAVALHGTYPWRRWFLEADGPLAPWVRDLFVVIDGLTGQGHVSLGSIDQARADFAQAQSPREESESDLAAEPFELSDEPSPADELVEEIIECGQGPLNPKWLERARNWGDEAIYALIDLAEDAELAVEDAPGGGYGPIHAVELLGKLQADEAVPALIDLVCECDPMEIIFSSALQALAEIGPPAVEPILKCLRYSRNIENKVHLCEPLGEIGQGNDQVYQAIAELLEQTSWEDGKTLVASVLGELGDSRALPLLYPLLDEPELDDWDWANLVEAIEMLGGEVDEDAYLEDYSTAVEMQDYLETLADSGAFASFVAQSPPDWQQNAEAISHGYTRLLEAQFLGHTLALVTEEVPDEVVQVLNQLIAALDEVSFDADLSEMPPEARAGYQHLAECAGPHLQWYSLGLWLAFLHYAGGDYNLELDPDPDDLLADVSGGTELDQLARAKIGRAGALVLRGRPVWPLWPGQLGQAPGEAVRAILFVRKILSDMYPLPPVDELDQQPGWNTHPFSAEPPPQAIQDLIDQLFEIRPGTDKPRAALIRRFKKHRAEVIPELIRLIESYYYQVVDAPGGGWTPVLAARLLAFLQAREAADALVGAAVDGDWDTVLRDVAIISLINLGEPVLPAVLNYFRYGRDDQGRVALAEVLGRIGRQEPASFDLLFALWERVGWLDYKRLVAAAFGALGDERAIPLLRQGLEDSQADLLDRDYMAWALATLEGNPPPTCTALGRLRQRRIRLPELYRARLVADEQDRYHLPNYTAWGEMLCPDCGGLLVLDNAGDWVHPPDSKRHAPTTSGQTKSSRPPRPPKQRRKKRKRR